MAMAALRQLLRLKPNPSVVYSSTVAPRPRPLLPPSLGCRTFNSGASEANSNTCEHRFPTTIAEAEQKVDQLRDSVKAMQQETIKDQQKLREQLTEFDKEIRSELAEVSSSVDSVRKAGNTLVAAVLGTQLLLIFVSKNQATAD